MTKSLYLHHELMLLALNDGTGTFASGMFVYSIAGAMVSELLIQDRIIVTDNNQHLVSTNSKKLTGDPILNELHQKINDSTSQRNLQHWVTVAAHLPRLNHRIAEQLCDSGVLRQDEKKILWIFTQQIYPELDGSIENKIREEMSDVMFQPQTKPSPRLAVLIALALHGDLLKNNFPADQLSQHKSRIKELAKGDHLASGAAKAAIEAAQAAIMVAVMIPTIIN